MRKYLQNLSAFVAVLGAIGCSATGEDRSAEAETAVRGVVKEWAEMAKRKDAAAFGAMYAEDAVFLFEQMPDLKGAPAIRAMVEGMMKDPAFALSFTPDRVVASRSGDLVYETGTYTMTMTSPDGKPHTVPGAYVTIWRLQPDGTWKCVLDAPVSDGGG